MPDNWFVREIFGLLITLAYVVVVPVVLARTTVFKELLREARGSSRYYVTVFLFLMMLSLPIKMLTRWLFNLKYVVYDPRVLLQYLVQPRSLVTRRDLTPVKSVRPDIATSAWRR